MVIKIMLINKNKWKWINEWCNQFKKSKTIKAWNKLLKSKEITTNKWETTKKIIEK